MKSRLKEITLLQQQLKESRPLSSLMVRKLKEDFLVKNTYHSNAIEGNTLTIYETKAILEDGITIQGKSMREHLEAINHKDAILLTEDIVKANEPFSERMIKDLHAIVLHGIDRQNAGTYRKEDVLISGAGHNPPSYYLVNEEMERFVKWYSEAKDLHPVEKAAITHSKFVNIHPFVDGNGRTARLLLNLELMKEGYLPVIVKQEDRPQYYGALDKAATTGDYTDFVNMISNYEKQELDRYLTLVKPKEKTNDELEL